MSDAKVISLMLGDGGGRRGEQLLLTAHVEGAKRKKHQKKARFH